MSAAMRTPDDTRRARVRAHLRDIGEEVDAAFTCLPSISGLQDALASGHVDEIRDALSGVREALSSIRQHAASALELP